MRLAAAVRYPRKMGGIQCLALMVGVAVAAFGNASGASQKDDAIRRARELLARQLATPELRVVLQSAEPAQWPNASLGCPEKGMQYAQMITSGYRVLLTVAGREYEVHVAGPHAVVCQPKDDAAKPGAGDRAAEIGRVSASARRDLATRLGITPAEVKVAVVRESSGKDTAACSPPEADCDVAAQVYEVELRAQDRTYRYLARQGRVAYCGPIS